VIHMGRIWLALALMLLIAAGLGGTASAAQAGDGGVHPENGSWSSNFTFFLDYRDPSGHVPAQGSVVLHLDNASFTMTENDALDRDSTDGKVYVFTWKPGRENVGEHSFYFTAAEGTEGGVRFPPEGSINGPLVLKAGARLICQASGGRASAGENVTIEGALLSSDENSPIGGATLNLYLVRYENETLVHTIQSGPDGGFSTDVEVAGQGVACYRIVFSGDTYYENAVSQMIYISSLDGGAILYGYLGAFAAVVLILGLLLTRGPGRGFSAGVSGAGAATGFLLMYVGAGELGVLAAGAISGYIYCRRTREWTKHLKIGVLTGIILVFLVGAVLAYILTLPPEYLRFNYSVTQDEIFTYLFQWSLYSAMLFLTFSGLGAVLGGFLHKLLKPEGKESSTVAGKSAAG